MSLFCKFLVVLFFFFSFQSCEKSSHNNADGQKNGIMREYYEDGSLKEMYYWYNGNVCFYDAFYNRSGGLDSFFYLKRMNPDSVNEFWYAKYDTLYEGNKVTLCNSKYVFNDKGELDSANSFFYKVNLLAGSDTILLGENFKMSIEVPCTHYKDNDSIYFSFHFKLPNSDSILIQDRLTPYTEFEYKPQKKGLYSFLFEVIEIVPNINQKYIYHGFYDLYVE